MSQIVKNVSHTPKDTLVDQMRDTFDLRGTDFHYLQHQFHLPGHISHFMQHMQLSFHIVRDILFHLRHNLLQSDPTNHSLV